MTENKGMHKMQCLRPDTYNAVHNLARHMIHVMKVHFEAKVGFRLEFKKTSERRKEGKRSKIVISFSSDMV